MLALFHASGHQRPYIYVGKLSLGEGAQHSKTEAPAVAHLERPVSGLRKVQAAWVGGQRSPTGLLRALCVIENALLVIKDSLVEKSKPYLLGSTDIAATPALGQAWFGLFPPPPLFSSGLSPPGPAAGVAAVGSRAVRVQGPPMSVPTP